MDASRDGGSDAAGGGGVGFGGGGRRARGLWLGTARSTTDGGITPGTAACKPRRKITFARLATCVLNVERTRRKTVSF